MSSESLDLSLIESIKSSDLKDIAVDLSEIGLDSLLEDGLLKDIPVFGSLVKLYKTGQTIRDALFAKKLLLFLQGISKVSPEQRRATIEKLNASEDFQKQVGENL